MWAPSPTTQSCSEGKRAPDQWGALSVDCHLLTVPFRGPRGGPAGREAGLYPSRALSFVIGSGLGGPAVFPAALPSLPR